MKIILLSLITLVGLAATAMAAPLLNSSFLPDTPRSYTVLVSQDTLPNSGEVSEAIHTGSYTYLHVTRDGTEEWLAIPSREVAVGAEVSYGNGAIMKNFHSGSLNRTFDEILFLGSVEVAGESAAAVAPVNPSVQTLPPGHSPVPGASANPADLPNGGQVSEVIAAGKYTYLQVMDDGKETWLAIPRRDVPVGARVRYADETPMKDFYSPSLKRTFAEVLFLGDVQLAEE